MVNARGREARIVDHVIKVTFCILRFAFVFALSISSVFANQLTADRPMVRMGDTFEVTLVLTDDAAASDRIPIPLRNVTFAGSPAEQSHFEWSNGRVSRRRILRYTARPLAEGTASVGPIRLETASGVVEIPMVVVNVLPPLLQQEEPGDALRRLESESREAVLLDLELDRDEIVVGEQLVATWVLYAGDAITSPTIIDLPELDGFWVEEIPDQGRRTTEIVSGGLVQRVVLRRAALFPLRSGSLQIGPLEAQVGVFRSLDPFRRSRRNTSVVKIGRSSPPTTVKVDPVPQATDLVGRFAAQCTEPVSVGGGPVSFEFSLKGEGNLRSAPLPRFATRPEGEVQISPGGLSVDRSGRRLQMARSWTVLLIPSSRAARELPPIGLTAWNSSTRSVDSLRCEPGTPRTVEAAASPSLTRRSRPPRAYETPDRGRWLAPVGAGTLILAGGLVWLGAARRKQNLRPMEQRILQHRDAPRAMKENVRQMLHERALDPERLYGADTPLADAYRALWSLLDVLEKEPWEKDRSADDLERRVREFVRRISRA